MALDSTFGSRRWLPEELVMDGEAPETQRPSTRV
jgi:hypothetical protein